MEVFLYYISFRAASYFPVVRALLFQMEANILSKRGRNKVIHDGYLFIVDATSKRDPELKFWRCEQKDRCKVRLHMKDGKVIRQLNEHTHEASAAKIEIERIKTTVKKRSAKTLEPPTVVVN